MSDLESKQDSGCEEEEEAIDTVYEHEAPGEVPQSLLRYFETSRSRAVRWERMVLRGDEEDEEEEEEREEEQNTECSVRESVVDFSSMLKDLDLQQVNGPLTSGPDPSLYFSSAEDNEEEDDDDEVSEEASMTVTPDEKSPLEQRSRQREEDFELELRTLREAERVKQQQLELEAHSAQTRLQREMHLQQEMLKSLRRRVEEESRKCAAEFKLEKNLQQNGLQRNTLDEQQRCSTTCSQREKTTAASAIITKHEPQNRIENEEKALSSHNETDLKETHENSEEQLHLKAKASKAVGAECTNKTVAKTQRDACTASKEEVFQQTNVVGFQHKTMKKTDTDETRGNGIIEQKVLDATQDTSTQNILGSDECKIMQQAVSSMDKTGFNGAEIVGGFRQEPTHKSIGKTTAVDANKIFETPSENKPKVSQNVCRSSSQTIFRETGDISSMASTVELEVPLEDEQKAPFLEAEIERNANLKLENQTRDDKCDVMLRNLQNRQVRFDRSGDATKKTDLSIQEISHRSFISQNSSSTTGSTLSRATGFEAAKKIHKICDQNEDCLEADSRQNKPFKQFTGNLEAENLNTKLSATFSNFGLGNRKEACLNAEPENYVILEKIQDGIQHNQDIVQSKVPDLTYEQGQGDFRANSRRFQPTKHLDETKAGLSDFEIGNLKAKLNTILLGNREEANWNRNGTNNIFEESQDGSQYNQEKGFCPDVQDTDREASSNKTEYAENSVSNEQCCKNSSKNTRDRADGVAFENVVTDSQEMTQNQHNIRQTSCTDWDFTHNVSISKGSVSVAKSEGCGQDERKEANSAKVPSSIKQEKQIDSSQKAVIGHKEDMIVDILRTRSDVVECKGAVMQHGGKINGTGETVSPQNSSLIYSQAVGTKVLSEFGHVRSLSNKCLIDLSELTERKDLPEMSSKLNGETSGVLKAFEDPNPDSTILNNTDHFSKTSQDKDRKPGLPRTESEGCDISGVSKNVCDAGGSDGSQWSGWRLPEQTEQMRLRWMKECVPWTRLMFQASKADPRPSGRGRSPEREAGVEGLTELIQKDVSSFSLSSLSTYPFLRSLTLRRCGLKSLENIKHLQNLSYIDAQENEISAVDCENLLHVRVLLLGQNRIRSTGGLRGARNLLRLDLSHNRLTRTGAVSSLQLLVSLSLSHNQICSLSGLSALPRLLHLDLSHNHLTSVDELQHCPLLLRLDLRGNSLTQCPDLKNQVLLRALLLDDNSISSLDSLTQLWLPMMHQLSVAHNRLTELPPLSHLLSLHTLDLSYNCLSEVLAVSSSVALCPFIREVCVEGNPLLQEPDWRSTLQRSVRGLRLIHGLSTDSGPAPAPAPGPGPGPGPSSSPVPGSFLSLCQHHLRQTRELQLRQSSEISGTQSSLQQLELGCSHLQQLFHLTQQQRFDHEYGDVTTALVEERENSRESDEAAVIEQRQQCTAPPVEKEERVQAAVVIQACWRGVRLRRRLRHALAQAQSSYPGYDDALDSLEPLEMEQFELDEASLDLDWTVLSEDESEEPLCAKEHNCDASTARKERESPHIFHRDNFIKERAGCATAQMVPEAWTSEPSEPSETSETSETSERASVASSLRSTTAMHPELSGLSERSQKIVKEWGFSEAHTARLMLRRAQKMNPTQNQHQRHNGGGTEGNRRFLPKLSSHIVNGGRVQLVTHRSGVRLESRSCPGLSSASTTRAEVLGPKRVSSAPSPKERISFRDKRLQQSTGWGSGKRTKPGLNQD